jgi:hypothetical protein
MNWRRYPKVYTPSQLRKYSVAGFDPKRPQRGYIPARPIVLMRTGFSRLKLAWMVFNGKFDVLDWEE